jgi:hypothetical protein
MRRTIASSSIGRAAEAAPDLEADMSDALSRQHPAVVLRSHYVYLRTLLAIAMIAVVGLTIAVVVLARDNDTGAPSVPSTRYDGGPEEGTRGPGH